MVGFRIVLNSYLLGSTYLVASQLVPQIEKLQRRIPLGISSLYSPEVQEYYRIPSELSGQQVELTDHYFTTFHQK